MSNNADSEETGLFGTVARLQEGGSVSGKQLADGFREAEKLTVSMKNLEDQVGNLLTRIHNGHAHLADVRRSVAITEAELSDLLSNGGGASVPSQACPPALAEDMWCRPLREDVWGPEGMELLERLLGGEGEQSARAAVLVELMRDVYEQERRLVELRMRMHEMNQGVPPFNVEWVSPIEKR